MTQYIFQRGETISLALDAVAGDPLTVSSISAAMKAVAPGRTGVAPDAPVAAAFTITPRSANGEQPAGWNLTVDAAVSAALVPGNYLADARLGAAGGVTITDSVAICIRDSVT
jgi:hypothetical protein